MGVNFPIQAITPPIAWVQIQNALTRWAQTTGLLVKWSRQVGGQPASPYIDLKVTNVKAISDDQQVPIYNSEAQTLTINATGQRQFVLNVQAYCLSDNPDSTPTGTMALQQWTNAEGYLTFLQSMLRYQPIHDALLQTQVSVIQPGDITVLDSIALGQFQSRASMDVRFATVSNFIAPPTDDFGFINHVSGTGDVSDNSRDFDVTGA
jgi:hypothetical protein